MGTPLSIAGIKYAVSQSSLSLLSSNQKTIDDRNTIIIEVAQTLNQTTKDKISALFSNVFITYS